MPISISCNQCGKTLVAPEAWAGKRVKCQECGNILTVPEAPSEPQPEASPAAAQPTSPPPSDMYQLSETEQAKHAPAKPKAGAAPAGGGPLATRACPQCKGALPPNAVLCTTCGFDLKKGKVLATSAGGAKISRKWIIVSAAALLVLVLVPVLLLTGKKDDAPVTVAKAPATKPAATKPAPKALPVKTPPKPATRPLAVKRPVPTPVTRPTRSTPTVAFLPAKLLQTTLPGKYHLHLTTQWREGQETTHSQSPALIVTSADEKFAIDFLGTNWSGSSEQIQQIELTVPFTDAGEEFKQLNSSPWLSSALFTLRFAEGALQVSLHGHQEYVAPTRRAPRAGEAAAPEPQDGFTSVACQLVPDGARGKTFGAVRGLPLAPGEMVRLMAHDGAATAVAVTPDAKRLVSGGADGSLRIWDLQKNSLIAERKLPLHHYAPLLVRLMPGGEQVLTAGGQGRNAQLKLWDLNSGEMIREFALLLDPRRPARKALDQDHWASKFTDLAVSVDGSVLMVAGTEALGVHLFDPGTGQRRTQMRRPAGGRVVLSEDGKLLVLGSEIYDVAQDQKLTVQSRSAVRIAGTSVVYPPALGDSASVDITSVALSPDKQLAVFAHRDNALTVWDIPRQTLMRHIFGQSWPAERMVFFPDGRRLLAGDAMGYLRLWDLDDGLGLLELASNPGWEPARVRRVARRSGRDEQVVTTIPPAAAAIRDVAVLPDGRRATTAHADGTVRIWDLNSSDPANATEEDLQIIDFSERMVAMSLINDARQVICVTSKGASELWELNPLRRASRSGAPESLEGQRGARGASRDYINHVLALSPDGKKLLADDRDGISLWFPSGKKPLRVLSPRGQSRDRGVFSQDGRACAHLSSQQINIYDTTSGRLTCQITNNKQVREGIDQMIFSKDGATLLTLTSGGEILAFDTAVGEQRRRYAVGRGRVAAISPDGRYVARGGTLAELLELSSGRIVRTYGEERHYLDGKDRERVIPITAVAFSPDGRRLLVGSEDGSVHLWDVVWGRQLAAWRWLPAPVDQLVVGPDGRTIAVLCHPGDSSTCFVWQLPERILQTGQTARAVSWLDGIGAMAQLSGHSGPTLALAFSPDGRTLASGGEDGTVRTWNIVEARQAAQMRGQHGPVQALTFTTLDNKPALLSFAADGIVRRWDAQSGQELSRPLGDSTRLLRISFSADGQYIAGIVPEARTKLWETRSGKVLIDVPGQVTADLMRCAVTQDGRFLLNWNPKHVFCRQIPAGSLTWHRPNVAPDGLSLDGWFLLRRNDLLEVQSGQYVLSVGQPRGEPPAREADWWNPVAVLMLPDNHHVLTANADGILQVWNVETGKVIQEQFATEGGAVRCMAVSPDGRTVATGGERAIQLWGPGSSVAVNMDAPTVATTDGEGSAPANGGNVTATPAPLEVTTPRLRITADEKEANRRLELANMLIRAGRPDKARLHLLQIVREYPNTQAATEANKLLEQTAKQVEEKAKPPQSN